jgi:hypothetical protein
MACVEGIFESTKEGERGNRKNNDVTTLLSIRTDMCLLSFWTVFNGYWIAFSPRSCRLLLRAQLKTSLQCKWTASSMVKRNNASMADSSSNTQINSSHSLPVPPCRAQQLIQVKPGTTTNNTVTINSGESNHQPSPRLVTVLGSTSVVSNIVI